MWYQYLEALAHWTGQQVQNKLVSLGTEVLRYKRDLLFAVPFHEAVSRGRANVNTCFATCALQHSQAGTARVPGTEGSWDVGLVVPELRKCLLRPRAPITASIGPVSY